MEKETLERILHFSHQVSNERTLTSLLRKLMSIFLNETSANRSIIFQSTSGDFNVVGRWLGKR